MKKIVYFFYAIRIKTLIASSSPIILSSVLCYKINSFDWMIFSFTLLAALLLQIMTNLINDLYDYRKGTDTKERIGPDRMVQKGYLLEKEIIFSIYCIFLFALFLGIYLVSVGGTIILLIGLSSFLFAYLYTATRFSIAYNGLGEIFVFLYFGVIASLGTFYLQTFKYANGPLLIGIIIGCLNTNLLIINNIRDYLSDKKSKKNTLIVKFGIFFGRLEFTIMFILSYVFLYIFSLEQNKPMIFIRTLPLSIFALYFIYNVISNQLFINYKALPLFSLYILLFTSLLTFNIFHVI